MTLKVLSSPKQSVIPGVCDACGIPPGVGPEDISIQTHGEKHVVLTLWPPVMLPQEKCAQYWPSDGSVSYGDITVELKKEEECESYTVRDLLVTNTRVRTLVFPHSMSSPLSQSDFIPGSLPPTPESPFPAARSSTIPSCCPQHQTSLLLPIPHTSPTPCPGNATSPQAAFLPGLLSQSPEPVGSLVQISQQLPDLQLCPPNRKTRAGRSGSSTSTDGQRLGSPGMGRG